MANSSIYQNIIPASNVTLSGGGNAETAISKISVSVGSDHSPVYFNNGAPSVMKDVYMVTPISYKWEQEITIPANGFIYLAFDSTKINHWYTIGVKLVNSTGTTSLDGNVSAMLGGNNYIMVYSKVAKSFTSLSAIIFTISV